MRGAYLALIIAGLLGLLLTAFLSVFTPRAHAATLPGANLSATPLGVDTSPRMPADSALNAKMNSYLKALGPVMVRAGGGTLGDAYFWQDNKDTYDCTEQWTSDDTRSCARKDTLSIPASLSYAKTGGNTVMPIVNYGSGTPAQAGAMAAYIKANFPATAPAVEIGNEPYGCASIINELTKPPLNDTGYEHGQPANCPYTLYGSVPGIEKMGQSYLTYAPSYIHAVKAADPGIKIELPYAISPPKNSAWAWDATMMRGLSDYDGLVVLWYPSYDSSTLSDAAALNSLRYIPGLAAGIKADLAKYGPGKPWQIGETNDTNSVNVAVCRPAGAVFAAGDALSWLAQGAQNVNWWWETDSNNSNGKCSQPDFAMFDGTGDPQPPYTGYLLASKLARPHAVLTAVNSGNSYLLEFHAQLRGGHQAVAYVNISATKTITVKGYPLPKANLPTFRYGNDRPSVVVTHTKTPATVTTAPDSVTVFTD